MPNRKLVRAFLAFVLLTAVDACRRPTDPDPLVGTYLATTFTVSSAGQGTVNVLAEGGTLGLNVSNNYVVTGTLIVPPSLNGGTTFTASMAGVLDTTGSRIRFVQSADTFVRGLTFTLVENRLEAVNQTVSGTTYELVLARQ